MERASSSRRLVNFQTGSESFAARATNPADEEITKASPGLLNAGSGGILGYRNAFPGDPFLAFWSGLGLFGNEAFAPAIAEFIAARRLGLDGSRVDPWIRAAFAQEARARGPLGWRLWPVRI